MNAEDVKCPTFVTGFGSGDNPSRFSCLRRIPFNVVFGCAYEGKSRQECLIKESALDWTIARPGVLTVGPRTGRYKILAEASQWRNRIVSRSDVADFLVRQIKELTYLDKTPVVAN